MFIVLYCSAIFMTEVVGRNCDEEYSVSFPDCGDMFSTVPRSMYTLFQVLTLESWSMAIVRPVLTKKPGLVIFFIMFLFITTFGLLNVVVGVIVENTLEASRSNTVALQKLRVLQIKKAIRALR